MREIVRWVSEARPDKDVGVGMTHYRVGQGEIRATNGMITAGHPWEGDAEFLVSGLEFEKVLARLGDEDEITITADLLGQLVMVESRRFTATIATLPINMWQYGGVDDAEWRPVPDNFVDVLRDLRHFVADKPVHAWAGCVALDENYCYATNNYAVAGAPCAVGEVKLLLSSHAVDFILRRQEDLIEWAHKPDQWVAFRWSSGAWMRVQLVEGKFHEDAMKWVREVYGRELSQEITGEFKAAFADVAGLAEDAVRIYADRIESTFRKSRIVAQAECELSPGKDCTVWAASVLAPVIEQATHWQPSDWPKRVPFRGDTIAGFVMGRKE